MIYISDSFITISYVHAPNTVKRYSELRKTISMSHRAPQLYWSVNWVLPAAHTMFVWAQAEKLRKNEYQRRQRRLIIEDALIIFWVCDSRYPKENHERSTTQNRLRPKHCYWNTCHTSKWDLPWSCQKMAIHVSIVSIILPLQQIVVMPLALVAKVFCDAFLASGPRKRKRNNSSIFQPVGDYFPESWFENDN